MSNTPSIPPFEAAPTGALKAEGRAGVESASLSSNVDDTTPAQNPTSNADELVAKKTDPESRQGLAGPDGSMWLEVDSTDTNSLRTPSGSTIADPVSYAEAGRTFTAYRDNRYLLPNDAIEQDRLDLQHEVFEQVLDRELGLAPIARGIPSFPANVLDIATGTGLWALEYAERHPSSHVIGTDLSLIQPTRELPNCQFIREDSEEPWIFDLKFDYVHLRTTCSCFSDHRTVVKQAFENMNEGGWIEYQDVMGVFNSFDGTSKGSALETLSKIWQQGFIKAGMGDIIQRVKSYKDYLSEAGFINVTETEYPVPTNPWPRDPKYKKLGLYNNADMSQVIELATVVKALPAAGLSPEEVKKLVHDACRDLSDTAIHAWQPFMFVYGQKPYSSKSEIKPENIATDPMEVDPTPEEESQEEILEMLKQVRSSRLGKAI